MRWREPQVNMLSLGDSRIAYLLESKQLLSANDVRVRYALLKNETVRAIRAFYSYASGSYRR